ncbi:PAS domain-containing protein [Helicobacter sp. 11S02596-1]|uniref:PAS domain-containing protein n=1 Tax=Helicobacter sp. 11S02596-1 TaxID=1476194 RepID=UPI000BA756C0|nr:PAS domain-containing protein [Helicobacter sp. 11S02596-1]PAF44500.1 histidine kinase [Helicobacter sp. 11S02596-1]
MEQELVLGTNTLITSKTDLRGRIIYCNQDFIDYAGLSEGELINKPHNIIRHPDMPKTVFSLLWDYVKSGKEIFAFVKNKSKDNQFYWVFANVTPSLDIQNNIIGYYSVRRKPNPKAIQVISDIYAQMVEVEKTQGITGGSQILKNLCEKFNKPYNQVIFDLQKDHK